MIGQLRGNISLLSDSQIIIDCQGVGYLVECSERTMKTSREQPLNATLLISTLVRDDAITLYGFSEPKEQRWFHLLQKVPGVAAKLSIHILSSLAPEYPGSFIAQNNEKAFLAISGVGKKLASRLISELKNHLEDNDHLAINSPSPHQKLHAEQYVQDAESALINLGYPPSQASHAVAKALEKQSHTPDSAILIKAALLEIRLLLSPSS
jgi:Holliday junction DNA helicase RuvA